MMTTSGEPGSPLPFPASLLSAIHSPAVTGRFGPRLPALKASVVRADHLAVACHETLRGIVTAQAHEVNAHGGLDESGEVSARTNGEDDGRHGDAEYHHGARVESEPLDLGRLLPALEQYVEVYLHGAADG